MPNVNMEAGQKGEDVLSTILVCPQCLGDLHGSIENVARQEDGSLHCPICSKTYPIIRGVPVFGVKASEKGERFTELEGENEWTFSANQLESHAEYAHLSARNAESTISALIAKGVMEEGRCPPKVLDLGAGWGAFQSWQFAKHGFWVCATEICLEFILPIEEVLADAYFERMVADCTVLPFRSESFDVIFCKELVHHLARPEDLFGEIFRVARPGGMIVVQEPCISILKNPRHEAQKDVARHAGITHHYYSFQQYLNWMNNIAEEIEVVGEPIELNPHNHPWLARIQKWTENGLGLSCTGAKITKSMSLRLLGGWAGYSGRRKTSSRLEKGVSYSSREVAVEPQQVSPRHHALQHYQSVLIPEVFKIYKLAHAAAVQREV
jgi:ubiquinone/menaquinone biosynthesis C-methylase UbiE/uncharacterized protein YbaR (Trm112 family)